ncbi:tRNA-modifying protein [Citrobacter koseri]|nr:tRNA-modifying protein [Citrobacter koseri]
MFKPLAMGYSSFTISHYYCVKQIRTLLWLFTPFPPRQPSASARLPLTLITLDDWALASITGADSEKYMQGQVTADVNQLTEQQHLLVAHCDAKGKMWSNLRLFRDGDGFAWIERRSLREAN